MAFRCADMVSLDCKTEAQVHRRNDSHLHIGLSGHSALMLG